MGTKKADRLKAVHIRLFAEDVKEVKRIAQERGLPYQIELRLLVRRALKGQSQDIIVLKERP